MTTQKTRRAANNRLKTFTAAIQVHGLLSAFCIVASASDWTQFRGVNSQGVSTETGLPTEWSETKNIVWKRDLPGKGTSSPVIWGKRLFLTAYTGYGLSKEDPGDPEDLILHLICLDRDTGRVLWQKDMVNRGEVHPYQNFVPLHGYASHTPVTDGQGIYCWFANHGAFAFDFDGKQLWQKVPSGLSSVSSYGSAASPVLYGDLLLINASVESGDFIALDKKTGNEIWRRKNISSYTTPVIAETPSGPELVLNRGKLLAAYDPLTGKDLWQHPHVQPGYVITIPCLHEGIIYANNGAASEIVAVRAGGRGDVSSTRQLWSYKGSTNIPSPVYANGYVFMSQDNLVLHCVRTSDGEVMFRKRMPHLRNIYASLLAAEEKIYVTGRHGRSLVIKAGPEFEVVAENEIRGDDSFFNASPAVSNGKLFIRSQKKLYCVGKGDNE